MKYEKSDRLFPVLYRNWYASDVADTGRLSWIYSDVCMSGGRVLSVLRMRVLKSDFQFLTVRLHKTGAALFRCPKIRKSNYA